jgi:hypothetical protein
VTGGNFLERLLVRSLEPAPGPSRLIRPRVGALFEPPAAWAVEVPDDEPSGLEAARPAAPAAVADSPPPRELATDIAGSPEVRRSDEGDQVLEPDVPAPAEPESLPAPGGAPARREAVTNVRPAGARRPPPAGPVPERPAPTARGRPSHTPIGPGSARAVDSANEPDLAGDVPREPELEQTVATIREELAGEPMGPGRPGRIVNVRSGPRPPAASAGPPAPAAAPRLSPAPVVHVTIEQVDVRAVPQPPAPPPRPRRPGGAAMDLDEYQRRRSQRDRR